MLESLQRLFLRWLHKTIATVVAKITVQSLSSIHNCKVGGFAQTVKSHSHSSNIVAHKIFNWYVQHSEHLYTVSTGTRQQL